MPKVVKSNQQFVFIHDAICEGPIEGLVYGDSSVYLNDARLRDISADSAFNPVKGEITFSGTTGAIQSNALPIQLLGTPENDNYIIIRGGAIAKSTATYSGGIFTITGASGFSSDYSTNLEADANAEFKKIVLVDPLTDTVILQGEGKQNGTDLEFTPDTTMQYLEYVAYTGTLNNYNVELVESVKINTIATSTSITTDNAPLLGNGTYKYRIAGSIAPNAEEETAEAPAKIDNTSVQFRKGSTFQNPISELNGSASGTPYTANLGALSSTQLRQIPATGTGGAADLGVPLYSTEGYPQGQSPDGAPIEINAVSLFGATAAATLDEIRISISYSNLVAVNKGNGDDLSNTAINLFQVKVKKPGETSFTGYRNAFRAGENVGQIKHTAETKSNISFEHYIDLEPFKPFTDFTVRVIRISRHLGKGVDQSGANYNDSVGDTDQGNSTGTISGVTGINKDKFTYPYTAHAGVFLDSKEFSSVPKRSYELRGMKVRVPEGYVPREYSNGSTPTYPSFWNGSLSSELYYTDNPAWVFYDLIANDRFGVGEWIKESDVDLFALYRISKYCDELVDDGNGGLEPRFRANVFLTKATDVYKVLKDMATIFTSIIYWMDGKMTTILDAPGDPIYNFSKANVIDGAFAYESTGEKTRVNQVVVTWNDPEAGYEQRPLVVEDRTSIIQAGRIVKQAAFAFGCTSEGQARRYGKWKLFTAQGQTEIVSFKASLDGAFLKPGDIIQIQDSDRYGTKLSGRVSSAANNSDPIPKSVITLDRTITLNNTATYELTVLITEPAAFYVGEGSVTVNGTTINRGDRLPSITSEQAATDAEDDAGDPIPTTWSEHTYVESLPVDSPVGAPQQFTQLTTNNGTYSSLPTRNSVWMLTETENNIQTVGSADLFRILAVSQDDKNIYSISAVEHYNEKYDFIDDPEAVLGIPDDVYPTEPEIITPPSQVYVLQNSNSTKPNEELTIQWDYPEFVDTGVLDQNSNPFLVESTRFLDGFEIFHTIPKLENPIIVGKRQRKYPFRDVPDGNYIFRVRSISTSENKSAWASARYLVEDPFKDNVNRIQGLQTEGLTTHFPYITNALGTDRGAYTNTTYFANDVVTDGGNSYSLSGSPSNVGGVSVSADNAANPGTWTLSQPGVLKFNDEGENVVLAPSRFKTDDTVSLTSGYSLSCTPMESVSFPETGNPRSAYVVLDHDTSTLKLIKADFDTDLNIFYWQDLTEFTTNPANVWDSLAGSSFSVAAESSKVVGVGTSFTSLNNLNKLKFDNGTIVAGARVAYVESDTVMYLDRNIGSDAFAGTAGQLSVQNYAPDFRKDVILGQVLYNTSNGNYRFKNFLSLDPSLVGGRSVILDSNVAFAQFDVSGNPILLPDSIIVDATATGFENPEFKVTYGGTGDANFSAEDTGFSVASPNAFKYEKTIYTNTGSNDLSYNAGASYVITVDVREANDPGNTDKQRSDTFTIFKVDNVAAGGEGAKIVNLELEDYSIVYDADGENPAFNSSSGNVGDITATATASPGFANPIFRFTIDGTQGSWISSADNTSTATYTVPSTIETWGSGTGGTRVFSVEVAEEPTNFPTVQPVAGDIEASDSASLLAVQIGQGGLAVSLSNPTHSLTADDTGVVSSNTGSGTTIEVFVGGVGIDYVSSGPVLGQWTISTITDTGGADITPGTPTTSGTGPVVANVPDHTFSGVNPLDDQESITYTITVPQGAGKSDLTATAIQTFSLAKGAAASTSSALVFLYAASSSQPADIGTGFPNVTADLSTGLISGYTNPSTDTAAVTNWYDSANGAAAGASSTDKIWVVAATGNGTGTTDTIAFGEWTTPVQFTGVDGFNTATIELYQLATSDSSAPADPTQGLTYTFSPPNLSTTGINGWDQSRPEPSRAFPYVWRISAAAVSNTSTDTIDTNDWSVGIVVDRFIEDGITLELTNDAETVGATTISTPLPTLSISTTAKVFQAGTDVTSEWDFSEVAATGITVSQATNTFTVTALTGAFTSGNVTITATPKAGGDYVGAASRSVNFTVTKVANGADGVSYRINPTSAVVSYDSNNPAWTPTSVTFSATKVTPTGSSAFTSGYWKLNGATQGQSATVSSGTIAATSGNITAQLYLDSGYTQLVDTESVPIVPSGEDGTPSTVPGPDGEIAPRVVQGFVYSTQNSVAPDADVADTTYTFSTGAFANLNSNWSLSPPSITFTAETTTYYAPFSAVEGINTSTNSRTNIATEGGTGTAGTLTFGSVAQGTVFTGLVTFREDATNGDILQYLGSDLTEIYGGFIKTGTIEASALNLTQTGGVIDISNFDNDSNFQTDTDVSTSLSSYITTTAAEGAFLSVNSGTGLTQGLSTSTATGNLTNFQGVATAGGLAYYSELYDPTNPTGGVVGNFQTALTSTGLFLESTLDASSDPGISVVANKLKLTASSLTLTSTQVGLGNVANKNEAAQLQGAFTSTTSITAGSINLKSGSAGIDISAANQRITITDTTGTVRVKLGQL